MRITFVILVLTVCACSNQATHDQVSQQSTEESLKAFYTAYILVNTPIPYKQDDSLKTKFYQAWAKANPGKPIDSAEVNDKYWTQQGDDQVRKRDSIQHKYLSAKLLEFYKRAENSDGASAETVLDQDPLLNSQVVDRKMLEHLEVKKSPDGDDVYDVTYTYLPDSPTPVIKLYLVNEGGSYKIDHIVNEVEGVKYTFPREKN